MKRILAFLAIALLPWFAMGQSSQDVFNAFKGEKDVTKVTITKYMFEMFADLDIESDDPEDQEFLQLIKGLDGITILTTEQSQHVKNLTDQVKKVIEKGGFKEMMIVEDQDQQVKFLVHEIEDQVDELIMFVDEPGNVVFMSIRGDIDLKSISRLSSKMNIKGMEGLEAMEEQEN